MKPLLLIVACILISLTGCKTLDFSSLLDPVQYESNELVLSFELNTNSVKDVVFIDDYPDFKTHHIGTLRTIEDSNYSFENKQAMIIKARKIGADALMHESTQWDNIFGSGYIKKYKALVYDPSSRNAYLKKIREEKRLAEEAKRLEEEKKLAAEKAEAERIAKIKQDVTDFAQNINPDWLYSERSAFVAQTFIRSGEESPKDYIGKIVTLWPQNPLLNPFAWKIESTSGDEAIIGLDYTAYYDDLVNHSWIIGKQKLFDSMKFYINDADNMFLEGQSIHGFYVIKGIHTYQTLLGEKKALEVEKIDLDVKQEIYDAELNERAVLLLMMIEGYR